MPSIPDLLNDVQVEAAAVLADVQIAEEQIARGEGIDHDRAERLSLAAFRQRQARPVK
jgi:hypothetical protein